MWRKALEEAIPERKRKETAVANNTVEGKEGEKKEEHEGNGEEKDEEAEKKEKE